MACKWSPEQRLVHTPSLTLFISAVCQWDGAVPGKDDTSCWKRAPFRAEQKDHNSRAPHCFSLDKNSHCNHPSIKPNVCFSNPYKLVCWICLSLKQVSCMAARWHLLSLLSVCEREIPVNTSFCPLAPVRQKLFLLWISNGSPTLRVGQYPRNHSKHLCQ